MQITTGIIMDIALLAVLLMVAVRGKNQGFLAGLVGLVGAVAAVIGGVWAGRNWAPLIYENHLGTLINEKVVSILAEQGAAAPAVLEKYAAFLPEQTRQAITELLQNAANGASGEVAAKITAALQPVLEPVIQMFVFLIACLLIRAVVRLLVHLLHAFNGVPLLGTVNRVLGFAFGFVTGTLDCWLICLGIWVVVSVTAGRWDWLSAGAVNKSILYSFFSQLNPLQIYY